MRKVNLEVTEKRVILAVDEKGESESYWEESNARSWWEKVILEVDEKKVILAVEENRVILEDVVWEWIILNWSSNSPFRITAKIDEKCQFLPSKMTNLNLYV